MVGQCVGGAWAVVGLCDRVEGQLTKIEVAPTRSLISKNAGCGASWWDARRLGTADATVAAAATADANAASSISASCNGHGHSHAQADQKA